MADVKTTQRTVVIACGSLAEATAALLTERLAEEKGPREVVAICAAMAEAELAERIPQALHEISQTAVREGLFRRGWLVDRLDELALFLIVDADDATGIETVEAAARLTTDAAQRILGVSTETLCLALSLAPGDVETRRVMARLAQIQGVDRGVIVLSPTNALGLRLPDSAALAGAAADILRALMTAPLRDAPEQAQQALSHVVPALPHAAPAPSAHNWQPETIRFLSAGLAQWQWPYEWEKEALVRCWLLQVLADWLRRWPGEGLAEAEKWLAVNEAEPEQLIRCLIEEPEGKVGFTTSPASSSLPQPWLLRAASQSLLDGVKDRNETATPGRARERSGNAVLDKRGRQLSERLRRSLNDHIRQLLNEGPVGGLSQAALILQDLPAALLEREEALAGRQARQAEHLDALQAWQEQAAAQIEAELAEWPGEGWLPWLKLALRPWHWPPAAWRYRTLILEMRRITALMNEQREWRRQQTAAETAAQTYATLRQEADRVRDRAEEVADMLGYVRQKIAAEAVETPTIAQDYPDELSHYLSRRLRSLAADRAAEAVWAATAVAATSAGGLAVQLENLNEGIVNELRRLAEVRIGEFSWTAVETLLFLYPDPADLEQWWRRQWETAAPLWRFDRDEQVGADDYQETAFVCARDEQPLRQSLAAIGVAAASADDQATTWLTTSDTAITLMRLRSSSARSDA